MGEAVQIRLQQLGKQWKEDPLSDFRTLRKMLAEEISPDPIEQKLRFWLRCR